MGNKLIAARDSFAKNHPEQRLQLNTREWGLVHVEGKGSTLIILPGTLGRGDIFWQQIEALEGRANILALSYPDSGSIADWSDDISALLNQHNIAKITIIGSSLGGFLAQYFAASFPDKIDHLIAANTLSSVYGLDQFPPYSLDLENVSIDKLRAGFIMAMQATVHEHPERTDLVDLLLKEVSGRISEAEIRARLSVLKFGPQLPDVSLSSEQITTIESQDDPLIPAPMREAVRARLQPATSYNFLVGSHFPYVIKPQQYTSLIEKCLGLESNIEIENTTEPSQIIEL